MTHNAHLDALIQTVAESLSEPGDVEQTLSRLTQTARDTVLNADYASICVRHAKGGLETIAPTSPLLCDADAIQQELHEGPSFGATADDDVIYSRDLSTDARWPTYGSRAHALGLMSQLAIGIAHPLQSGASLNLYSRARDAFEDYRRVADVFSSQAKVALRFAQELQTLSLALTSGTTIGRATGVMMERKGIEAETALRFLVDLANSTNGQLLDAAEFMLQPLPFKSRKRV